MDEPLDPDETVATGSSGSSSHVATTDPASVGRYRILRQIGQGGFGRVYLAHDDALGRPVAVKIPRAERIAGPEDLEAYLDESRTLARLDHPHIVPVYDVGRTEGGLCYVVSKFIEGSDLASRMGASRPSHRESAALVATIAEALHHAHKHGLVHRDVKPANILLDASGKALLADFGLALKDEDYGRGASVAGSPAYMSPEQARGESRRVDGRSDIFSLGVVLYELLTGRRPFRGQTARELLEDIIHAEARPPRQIDDAIPQELERICLKALSRRASERHTTALDLANDLKRWAGSVHPEDGDSLHALSDADGPQGRTGRQWGFRLRAVIGGRWGCLLHVAVGSLAILMMATFLVPRPYIRTSARVELPGFEDLLRNQPGSFHELGHRFLEQGDYPAAVRAFTQGIEASQHGGDEDRRLAVECYLGRSHAYSRLNQDEQAASDLWKAHELDPRVFFQGWKPGP